MSVAKLLPDINGKVTKMEPIKRIYVEKKTPFAIEAESLFFDLRENLGIQNLTGVRMLNRYDISGLTAAEYNTARKTIFSEPPLDWVYDEEVQIEDDETMITVEYLPGQYDQRADSAAQCIQIITLKNRPLIAAARVVILKGSLSPHEQGKIKNWLINPVDSREASPEKPKTLRRDFEVPVQVEMLTGFTH